MLYYLAFCACFTIVWQCNYTPWAVSSSMKSQAFSYISFQFNSVQSLSCVRLSDSMDCSMPGLPVHHQPLELAQTHVHRVGYAIQPSHPLSSPSPPAFNLSQHQGLFQWVSSSPSGGQSIGALASVLPMNIKHWFHLGLIGLISLLSKGLSRVFPNTTVQKHQFFGTQLSYTLGWKIRTCDPKGQSFKQTEYHGTCVLFFPKHGRKNKRVSLKM